MIFDWKFHHHFIFWDAEIPQDDGPETLMHKMQQTLEKHTAHINTNNNTVE